MHIIYHQLDKRNDDKLKAQIALFARHQKTFMILCLIFLCGVAVGSVAIHFTPVQQILESKDTLIGAISSGTANPMSAVWLSFLNNAKPILFIWVMGFLPFGLPLCYITVGYRGMLIGISIFTFLKLFKSYGLIVSAVCIGPGYMLYIPLLFFSVIVLGRFFCRDNGITKKLLLYYFYWLLGLLCGTFAIALIEGYVTGNLIPLLF